MNAIIGRSPSEQPLLSVVDHSTKPLTPIVYSDIDLVHHDLTECILELENEDGIALGTQAVPLLDIVAWAFEHGYQPKRMLPHNVKTWSKAINMVEPR